MILEFYSNWLRLITLCENITLSWSCGPDGSIKSAMGVKVMEFFHCLCYFRRILLIFKRNTGGSDHNLSTLFTFLFTLPGGQLWPDLDMLCVRSTECFGAVVAEQTIQSQI